MGQLVIEDVAEDVIERLRARAQARNRSLEAELRDILDVADAETARKAADEIRHRLAGRIHGDSAELIREDRDR